MVSLTRKEICHFIYIVFRYESQVYKLSYLLSCFSFQFVRLRHAGYRVSRPPNHIGRYKMVRHEKQIPATNRYVISLIQY
jgi:hypothetical protein